MDDNLLKPHICLEFAGSAVHEELGASRIGRGVRQEEERSLRHLFRSAEALLKRVLRHTL